MADLITREAFFAKRSLPRETVHIPELGGDVIVQGLTGKQRDQYEASCVQTKNGQRTFNLLDARAKLIALSVVNEDGKRFFEGSDVAGISAMPAAIVDRIFAVAQRLSGITQQDVEDLGKLFSDDPDESSRSDSSANSEG